MDFPVFPHTKPRLREAPQEPPADFPVKAHLMGEAERQSREAERQSREAGYLSATSGSLYLSATSGSREAEVQHR